MRLAGLGKGIVLFAFLLGSSACNTPGGFSWGPFGFTIGDPPPPEAVATLPDPVPGDGGEEAGGEGDTPSPADPPVIPLDPICDPFGGETPPEPESGLVAALTYFDEDPPSSDLVVADFIPGSSGIVLVANPVFLSLLNKPTSSFEEGFSANGTLVKKLNGDLLVEYFALFIAGQIKLGPDDPEGEYQFAILTDDGAVLYFKPGTNWVKAIDNNGTHPNKMGCSERFTLTRDHNLPVEMGYFQAPRYHISLMMFWRKGESLAVPEPFCDGNHRGNDFFFTRPDGSPPVPTANYEAFLSRGWQVIGAKNYILPSNVPENPCP